jgi:hypothetical protein
MADNENLDIYLRAKNETDPAFKKAGDNVSGLQGKAKGLTGGLKGLTAGFADISGAMNVAGMVMGQVGRAYDRVMTQTMDWGNLVEDTGRLIGENAEQTSRLLVAGRSLGIEQQTLTTALETAISKGVRPNIAGLSKLADEYQAIQDPLQRSAFLMTNFGRRAGPEMAELLSGGSAGLREYLQEAERTGMVINDRAVAAAERFQIANERLQQRIDGMAIALGNTLIPAVTVAIDAFTKTSDVIQDNDLQMLASIPVVGQLAQGYLFLANGIESAKQQELDLIATLARTELDKIRFGNNGGIRHQYASDTQQGVGRGNLYTGEVYHPPQGRAGGGPMWAGVSRPVGENGMEWFTPGTSGTISDAPAGGGGVSIGQVTIQIQSSEPRAVRREVEQALRDLQAVGRL